MADDAGGTNISKQISTGEDNVPGDRNVNSDTRSSGTDNSSINIADVNIATSSNIKKVVDSSLTKQQTVIDEGIRIAESRSHKVADKEQDLESSKSEDEYDVVLDELMDSLDVVDSWVDTAEECPSESVEKSDTNKDVEKIDSNTLDHDGDKNKCPSESVEKSDTNKDVEKIDSNTLDCDRDKNKSSSDNLEREKRSINRDKKMSDTDVNSSGRNNQDKKVISNETTEHTHNRGPVRRGRSPDRSLRKERQSRDAESRRERSPNRSNKPGDNSRKNNEKGAEHGGNTSSSNRRRRNSKTRRSRTRSQDRNTHYNSERNDRRVRNYQTNKETSHYSNRTTSSYQKRNRSMERDKRSSKKPNSTGKETTKPSSTNTVKAGDSNQIKFKTISPEDLVPPGTEDDVLIEAEGKVPSPLGDALVPPGTEDILLPDAVGLGKVKEEASSSKKRKLSSSDSNKKCKSSKERDISRNDKERQGEKRKRLTSTEEDSKLRELRTDREKIARDQDRISRELSLERLRESRNREMLDRDKFRSRDRFSPRQRAREETARRSTSFGRRSSVDSRWETSSRDFRRRYGDLSPISPGRMSRGSPLSFEFSPVSSRSSSRERLRTEYQRGKFRSYSPISSGSDLSRSLFPMSSSDDEREPRSRRRRRLPFLDEMERKLGLKLTGGHNINQQLRSSQQIAMDCNIDRSAPPPGTYPMRYPPPVSFPTPFPHAANPVYSTPPPFVPTPIPKPVISTERPPPNIAMALPAPVVCPPPTKPSQTAQTAERQLVTIPREPLKVIAYKFQRPIQKTPEVPDAPPPPTISSGAVKGEMSLSSILEASVKVGGKNPVDEARLQRCRIAIQTLQEDESFSLITLGRFTVQPEPNNARYCAFARFDHPAQESMFKLKSPLLRNQPVSLKFTTQPTVPYKPNTEKITSEKQGSSAIVLPRKSSIWPKNSERKPAEKKELIVPNEEEDEDDPDVCIVERPNTVVSISSESDHEMNLSLVSDISDVSADEGDDKLENVSSGEDDFNQCSTCVECNRVKKMVNASTQYQNLVTRSVNVQVDFVNEQLMGMCEVARAVGGDQSSLNQSVHSNASSISSCSSNELTSSSPTNQTPCILPSTDVFPSKASMLTGGRHTAQSFLKSVVDTSPCPPSTVSSTQSSGNQGSSSYKPFVNTVNPFPNNSSQNLSPNRFMNQLESGNNPPSNISSNKSFKEISNSSNLQSYVGSAPFRSSSFPTLNSGSTLGSISSSLPVRGILKTSHPVDVQSKSTANISPSSLGANFRDTFQPTTPFQGGNMPKGQQQNPVNQQSTGIPSFLGGSASRQVPLYRNQNTQNQQSIGGQLFQGCSFFSTLGKNSQQSGGTQAQPFRSSVVNPSQQESSRPSFPSGNSPGQLFSDNLRSQNTSFQSGSSQQSLAGSMSKQNQPGPFQSSGIFKQQSMSTNFRSIFGGSGSRPATALPPTPVPAPTSSQQRFLGPSGGLGVNTNPLRMNRDQQQTYFGSTPRQQR